MRRNAAKSARVSVCMAYHGKRVWLPVVCEGFEADADNGLVLFVLPRSVPPLMAPHIAGWPVQVFAGPQTTFEVGMV